MSLLNLQVLCIFVNMINLSIGEEDCPFGQFSFIRIVNTRPSESIISKLNISKDLSLSSCYHHCHLNPNCSAYFADHLNHQCVYIMSSHLDMLSANLEMSSNWSFYKKFCIPFGKLHKNNL